MLVPLIHIFTWALIQELLSSWRDWNQSHQRRAEEGKLRGWAFHFLLCLCCHRCSFSMCSYLQNTMPQCIWAQNASRLRQKCTTLSQADIQVKNMEEMGAAGLTTNYLQGFYYSPMADMAHLIIVHCSAQSKSLYCIRSTSQLRGFFTSLLFYFW